MNEFLGARGVIINGREQNGRTYQREDGTYEALDLKDVQAGEVVTILTDEGGQELVRQKGQEYDSALANWKLGRKVVNVALSEPTGQGTDFIHHGIVLKEKLGLQVSYPESKKPHVVYGLGAIASIVSVKPLDPWVVRQWRTLRTKLFSI